MSKYVVSDMENEFGIEHIEADNRHEAAEKYVRAEILDFASRDIVELTDIEIGVVLESHVKMFKIAPSFEIV